MYGILHNRKGFTLVELIVVTIIVGILAAVAIPMMTGNVERAKKSEAMAALGSYRTAFRLYMAENNGVAPGTKAKLEAYVRNSDVDGKYFMNSHYGELSGNVMTANNAGVTCNMNLYTGELSYN